MNLILCGMMGSGKSTVGAKIAQLVGLKFCDTDQIITEKYGDISAIFNEHGEEYFRQLEAETVQGLVMQDGLMISTGGGLVLKKSNVDALKKTGKIVYLRATVETLSNRLKGDLSRPLLQSETESLTDRLTRILSIRSDIYTSVADYIVDVDKKSADDVAKEIIEQTKIDKTKGAGTK